MFQTITVHNNNKPNYTKIDKEWHKFYENIWPILKPTVKLINSCSKEKYDYELVLNKWKNKPVKPCFYAEFESSSLIIIFDCFGTDRLIKETEKSKTYEIIPNLKIEILVNTHYEDMEYGNLSTMYPKNKIEYSGEEFYKLTPKKLLNRVKKAIKLLSSYQDKFNELEKEVSQLEI